MAVLMAMGLGCVAVLSKMLWAGALGLDASLVIGNSGLSFASSRIVASDAAFGMVPVTRQNGTRQALRAGFSGASLDGLCISKTESIAGLGTVTFKLTSGDGSAATNEIKASNASFDVVDLQAKNSGVQLQGSVQVGQATPDLTTVPGSAPYNSNPMGQVNSSFSNGLLEMYNSSIWTGTANGGYLNGQGFVGVDASQATLTTVYGKILQAQISGSIDLPNLSISVLPGTQQSCEALAASDYSSGYFPGIR